MTASRSTLSTFVVVHIPSSPELHLCVVLSWETQPGFCYMARSGKAFCATFAFERV